MARAAAGLADTEEVSNLAQGMVRSRESEMRLMADMLAERGARP